MTLAERNDAREAVQHPGKFEREHPMVPILYDKVLEGVADDTQSFGDDGFVDCYDLVGRWVLHSSDSGFITGARFDTTAKAIEAMGKIHAEAEAEEAAAEEEEEEEEEPTVGGAGHQSALL
jgi:hypothetical protein